MNDVFVYVPFLKIKIWFHLRRLVSYLLIFWILLRIFFWTLISTHQLRVRYISLQIEYSELARRVFKAKTKPVVVTNIFILTPFIISIPFPLLLLCSSRLFTKIEDILFDIHEPRTMQIEIWEKEKFWSQAHIEYHSLF